MKEILRSIQTRFPFLHDFRFLLKLNMMKIRSIPHENDFNAIELFKPDADEVFVDIGANRGESILSMRIKKPGVKIIAFEPNELIFNKLEDFFNNYDNLEVYNYGLGNEDKKLEFYIPFYRKWMFDGLASFKYDEAKDWLKSRMWNYKESRLSIKKIESQVKKLDDFKLKPYFIKIDVQGFELEVLQGSEETIKMYKPILLIESLKSEHKEFLRKFNYEFYNYDTGILKIGEGKLNTFCIESVKYSQIVD